jgi:uncharacterized protein (DUF924 family)
MRGYNITSALHKVFLSPIAQDFTDLFRQILGLQAAFKSTIRVPFTSFRAMSSITPLDPDINRTVSYWFDGPDPVKKWFGGGPQVDAEIKEQFGGLVEKARADKLNAWTEQPTGTLALILLLDQFPRNIFRGSALSFSSDAQALKVATEGVAKGFDRQVPHMQQPFFYLPMMHDETLLGQIAGIAMFESLLARCDPESEIAMHSKKSIGFAKSHLYCILHFGRFPSRNEILGRESTPEEIEYLKEHPSGF